MDMLKLSMLMKKTTFTNAGSVIQKESFMYTKIMLITAIAILTSSCTNFAMLSSGATIAVSHNAYAKVYGGIDILTIMQTDKDIKTNLFHNLKKEKND
tara:strand:+ start:148 stop:441 length:294 start_codon:yes stop_codon:yes gene_type:complete